MYNFAILIWCLFVTLTKLWVPPAVATLATGTPFVPPDKDPIWIAIHTIANFALSWIIAWMVFSIGSAASRRQRKPIVKNRFYLLWAAFAAIAAIAPL